MSRNFRRVARSVLILMVAVPASLEPRPAAAVDLMLETTFISFEAGSSGNFGVADFNNDQLPDVVCLSAIGNSGTVLMNAGNGAYAPGVGFPTAVLPTDVAIGDINIDGRQDLVITCAGSNYIYSKLGNGDGTFQWPEAQITGSGPSAVALADVNGDGFPDALVANGTEHSWSVLPGLGNGFFGARTSYALGNWSQDDIVTGLLNDDPYIDVVCVGGGVISIFLNDGTGGFGPPLHINTGSPKEAVIEDFDRDGRLDIVVVNGGSSGTIRVLRGNGNGTFTSIGSYAVGLYPTSLDAADLNGDGERDIITCSTGGAGGYDDAFTIWFGNGDGTFGNRRDYTTGHGPDQVRAADVDKDGLIDILAVRSGRLAVSANRGEFGRRFTFPVVDATDVAAGDFDEDGTLDLAVCGGGNVSLLAGDGRGNYGTAVSFPTGGTTSSLVALDFNQDNHLDVVTSISGGSTISILLGNGTGTLAPKTEFYAGPNANYVAAGDFNEDGWPDLAVTSSGNSAVSILINAQGGAFFWPVTYPAGSGLSWVVAGDLNHDGHMDLVALNRNAGGNPGCPSIARYLGNGDGTFGTTRYFCVSGRSIDLGDVNEDGNLDVVAVGLTGGLSFMAGDGLGGFAAAVTMPGSSRGYEVALSDLNGDSHLDVVISSESYDYVSVLFGLGNGTFEGRVDYGVRNRPTGLHVADINGDFFADVISANQSDKSVSVLLNRYNALSRVPDEGARPVAWLSPPYPNPFRTITTFDFAVPEMSPTRITIFDVEGRRIRRLTEGPVEAGRYRLSWDGLTDAGDRARAGLYYIRMETAGRSGSRSVLLLR